MERLPLEDVLVVGIENAAAGPICTRNLADLGARVIRVERPGEGDVIRQSDKCIGGRSSFDLWVNPGKESITLDVKRPEGLEVLLRLVERADIVVENLRPGAAADAGITYELLAKRNPRVVFCQLSGYGQEGPFSGRKAFDQMIQGEVGMIDLTGNEAGPARVGGTVIDVVAGMSASFAVMAALHGARAIGIGQYIDLSMLEAGAWFLANLPFRYWYMQDVPQRFGLRHPHQSIYGVYEVCDGSINIAVITQPTWQAFCRVIGRTDLLADERFGTNESRREHRSALNAIIEPILRSHKAAEIIPVLEAAGIPCGQVRTFAEAIGSPQLEHRGFYQELPSEDGPTKVVSFPAKFGGRYPTPRSIPPRLGEHTEAVLLEFGWTQDDIAKLRAEGVI